MKTKLLITAAGCFGAVVVFGQAPPPAPAQTGPGVQALQDAKYPDFIKQCKNPPAGRGGGGAARGAAPAAPGAGQGGAAAAGRGGANAAPAAGPPAARDYTVTAIPGVIAAGAKWKSIWTGTGNNADGLVATKDGGILAAQNTNSDVMLIDKDGKVSFPYKDTNTGGAVAMNKKGALFLVSRGLPQAILQLEPQRKVLANMYKGEPFECAGGLVNDLTADSKGGVYFTMGGVYHANAKGEVTKYGTVGGNGIILSRDEKTLYVTGRLASAAPAAAANPAPATGALAAAGAAGAQAGAGGGRGAAPGGNGGLVAFDVMPDGSLANERQFALVGGDGTTVDAQGRVYTTSNGEAGVYVLSPDGKVLGQIPTPQNFITVAFSGKDKKTLYGVFNNQRFDEIFTIDMIAQGYKGRGK